MLNFADSGHLIIRATSGMRGEILDLVVHIDLTFKSLADV